MALGMLPKKLLAPKIEVLNEVIDCLCKAASKDSKVGQEPDAMTRRNAIEALSRLSRTVGIKTTSPSLRGASNTVELGENQVNLIFECLFSCAEDYNKDRRGDVGSWSRIAAMSALEDLIYISVRASFKEHGISLADDFDQSKNLMYFDDFLCERALQVFLKQLSEKLDAVRLHAGSCLERILRSKNPMIPFVPQRRLFIDTLDQHSKISYTESEEINWANPAITFPIVMQLAQIPSVFHSIISGIVISVGGLTESVVRNSRAAMVNWIRSVQKNENNGIKELEKLGSGKFSFENTMFDIIVLIRKKFIARSLFS